jgi:uncharacterized protein YneF (UPF0154 family)|tara:strand:- start:2102 stop:2503 length:402 start_codon:yes stop_codon:yes gene_type:complete
MENIFLLLLCILLLITLFLILNFKWIVKETRSICEDESGYVKLIQLFFILLVLFSFFILLIHSLNSNEVTSKLDIFLTVIVGLMGTIIGTFFSDRTMESIKKDRDRKRREIIKKSAKIKEYQKALNKILEKLH